MIAILCIIILIESSCIAWLLIKCKAENEARWDEISRSATYEEEMECLDNDAKFYQSRWKNALVKNAELQSKLSKTLCPTNNHVWEEMSDNSGIYKCKKCDAIDVFTESKYV